MMPVYYLTWVDQHDNNTLAIHILDNNMVTVKRSIYRSDVSRARNDMKTVWDIYMFDAFMKVIETEGDESVFDDMQIWEAIDFMVENNPSEKYVVGKMRSALGATDAQTEAVRLLANVAVALLQTRTEREST